MAVTSTNRERAVPFRGHRHYFQRPTGVGAWKIRLSILALLATLGWLVSSLASKERMYAETSHGPLSHAHAPWDSRCDACHTPFGSDDNTAGGLFDARDRWRSFRCEGCHAGAKSDPKNYAPHYSTAHGTKDDPTARGCSSCHHDHQGRDFALSKTSDAACLRCHQDLNQLHSGTTTPSITSFHRDHPEFRAVKRVGDYQRTLKFNHALHLSLGVSHSAEDAGLHGLTPGKLPEKYRGQYLPYTASGSDQDPIRLDCVACHTSKGDYYQPVVFEKHCQACHSLEVSGLKSTAGITLQKFDVPHRQQPAELDRFLRGEITRQVFANSKLKLDPLPRGDRLDSPRDLPLPPEFGKEVDSLVRKVNELLYDLPTAPKDAIPNLPRSTLRGGHQCLKCHDADGGNAFEPPKSIVKPSSPDVWLTRGRFNHAAHRAVDCAQCHVDKKAAFVSPAERVVKEPMGIPGIDNCKQCHKPASQGGVRDSCIDCHRYHNGGSPLREIPAENRLTIPQFLEGARPGRGP
jgi:predicted CXXCH cytochrome family protein